MNNILFFMRGYSIRFIVGRLVGASGLGVLTLSSEISGSVTSELTQPVNRALFPGYADLDGSSDAMRMPYLNVVSGVALFIIPAGLGLSIIAPDAIPVLLGNQWISAIVPIQVLSIYGVIFSLQGNGDTVLLALGRPRLVAMMAAVSVAISLPVLILFTMKGGLLGACFGLLVSVTAMATINMAVVCRVLTIRVSMLANVVWRPIVASIAMVIVCMAFQSIVPGESLTDRILRLVLTIVLGACAYTALIALLWVLSGRPTGAENFVFGRIFSRPANRNSGAT